MNQTLLIALTAMLAGLATTGFVWFGLGFVERVNYDLGKWRAARKAAAAAKAEDGADHDAEDDGSR